MNLMSVASGMKNPRDGFLRVMNNTQLDQVEREQWERDNPKKQQVVTELAAHISRCWSEARDAKVDHQREMLRSLRLRKGEYEPHIKAMIDQEGGSDIFMRLTDVKCRAAESWIADILLQNDDLWVLEATDIPEISPQQEQAMYQQAQRLIEQGGYTPEEAEVMLDEAKRSIKKQIKQLADTAAERMSTKIRDQLQEAGFRKVLEEFISDVVTFKAGIIKGPYVKRVPTLKWRAVGNVMQPVVSEELSIAIERVSPLDAYPSPHATTFDDGYFMVRRELSTDDLFRMMKMKGNNEEAIRRILDLYGVSGLNDWIDTLDHERDQLEGKRSARHYESGSGITALEYRGPAMGKMLIEWGVDPARIDDPLKTYQIEAWLINHDVVRCVLNGDPLGKKPYSKASAVNVPGSFWGMGVAEQMEDIQRICNVAARALADNMAMASGPQVAIGIGQLPEGMDVTDIKPWKIWQLIQSDSGQVPIQFFQPDMHAGVLLEIYERFARMADEVTGIPAYAYGSDLAAGAGKTASGLQMLMANASKGIKRIISNIDYAVSQVIERAYIHNMIHDKDMSIKGDAKVVARGALALIQKEAIQAQRQEMLQVTNNPMDAQIIGIEGRAEMLREAFKPLDYQTDIIPSMEALKERLMEQAEQERNAQEIQDARQRRLAA